MATKRKKGGITQRYTALGEALRVGVPQFFSWSEDVEEFISISLKMRSDGTVLAVAKGYGADGTEMVCFGSGYGVAGALVAIDSTIAGAYWKVDKPWQP